TEPPRSGGTGSAGAGSGIKGGVGSTEPPRSGGTGSAGAGSGIRVPAGAAGERLDRFLATQLGSRAAAERAVEAGALVDGVARAKSFRLEGGGGGGRAGGRPA